MNKELAHEYVDKMKAADKEQGGEGFDMRWWCYNSSLYRGIFEQSDIGRPDYSSSVVSENMCGTSMCFAGGIYLLDNPKATFFSVESDAKHYAEERLDLDQDECKVLFDYNNWEIEARDLYDLDKWAGLRLQIDLMEP